MGQGVQFLSDVYIYIYIYIIGDGEWYPKPKPYTLHQAGQDVPSQKRKDKDVPAGNNPVRVVL
jgi:hypothetical protein